MLIFKNSKQLIAAATNISISLWQPCCVNIIYREPTTWLQCLHCSKCTFGLIFNFHLKRSYRNADVVLRVGLVKIFVTWVPANVVAPNTLCEESQYAALVWPFQYTVIVFQHFPHRLVWLPTEAEVSNKPINMQNIEQSSSAQQPSAKGEINTWLQSGRWLLTLVFLSCARLLPVLSESYFTCQTSTHGSTGRLMHLQK